ncbi:hypothetical protein BD310DRAFT_122596 [Dichomitus squalens]|uniref:Uncharacterized protein n=1 Tax=Dichomitus squalens TaxID=114155 RepID=A0A4Q9Q491_9APHY|nr:hypothetical protein BD310DRAFT_122596 [Dichomitus squalens]
MMLERGFLLRLGRLACLPSGLDPLPCHEETDDKRQDRSRLFSTGQHPAKPRPAPSTAQHIVFYSSPCCDALPRPAYACKSHRVNSPYQATRREISAPLLFGSSSLGWDFPRRYESLELLRPTVLCPPGHCNAIRCRRQEHRRARG